MKFNKLFILMFVMVFLVGTVSAIEWDNGIKYRNNDLTVDFENGYFYGFGKWFGLNSKIGEVTLKSHKSVNEVKGYGYGQEKVTMYYKFNDWELYPDGLGEVTFTDQNTGKEIEKDYYFVQQIYKDFEVQNSEGTCDVLVNGTESCSYGYHVESLLIWERLKNNSIPKGNTTIGLKTYVKKGDYLDAVWEVAGKKIKKHALWTATDGQVVYWELDEASGTLFDEQNNVNMSPSGTPLFSETGIILTAVGFNSNLDFFVNVSGVDFTNLNFGTTGDFTINYWLNNSETGGDNHIFFSRSDGTDQYNTFISGAGGVLFWRIGSGGGRSLSVTGTADGNYHMYTFIRNNTGQDMWIYVDSVLNVSSLSGVLHSADAREFFFGDERTDRFTDLIMDEFGIWNQSFDGDRIEEIWNTGLACSFGDNSCGIKFPTITLDAPSNNTNFTLTNNVVMNATIFDDTNITNVTLYLNDVGNETNSTSGINNTVWTFTKNMGEGDTFWTIEACNFDNNCINASEGQRLFNVNTTPNIQYGVGVPVNEFNSTNNFFEVNVTVTEALFQNITFDLYNVNGALNRTVTFTNSSRDKNWTNLIDSTYSYNVTVATTTNQFNSTATRNISFDTFFPTIIVTSPTGDQGTFPLGGTTLSLNWNTTDANLDTCQYDYEGSNTTVTCSLNVTTLIVTDSTATSLIFYVNDTFGQISSNSTSWFYSFIENDVEFNSTPFETDSQFFEINLSTSLNVSSISAQLNYNGTNFISSAICDDFCIVNNTIDIPLVTSGEFENKSFFWEISIFNGTTSISVNTSLREQNVTRIHLEECGGSFTTEALNFTAYDEQNLSRIDPFLFDGNFDQWLGGGTVKRQSNFSQSSTSDLDLCISPTDETFFIDSTIEYDEAGNESVYTLRNYYFQNDTINSTSQDIFMYLLLDDSSTSFILKVQDDALLPVPNVLIETNRFYPGLNEFRIVQIAKSDQQGKSVGFFETEIVDYKFIITLNNNNLLETGLQKIIPESSPFTLTFNLGENLGDPWSSQFPLDDLISTLVWNDDSGIITYTYIDSSTELTLARLFVFQQSLVNSSADNTLCNVNSSLTSAVLTCNVGNDSGFYTASAFITRGTTETLDLQIGFQIETLSSVVGLLGLFYGWFLILIASFMFKFNEIAGIWAITIVVLLVNLIGIINFGGVFVTAIIGVAVFLTWLMSN